MVGCGYSCIAAIFYMVGAGRDLSLHYDGSLDCDRFLFVLPAARIALLAKQELISCL